MRPAPVWRRRLAILSRPGADVYSRPRLSLSGRRLGRPTGVLQPAPLNLAVGYNAGLDDSLTAAPEAAKLYSSLNDQERTMPRRLPSTVDDCRTVLSRHSSVVSSGELTPGSSGEHLIFNPQLGIGRGAKPANSTGFTSLRSMQYPRNGGRRSRRTQLLYFQQNIDKQTCQKPPCNRRVTGRLALQRKPGRVAPGSEVWHTNQAGMSFRISHIRRCVFPPLRHASKAENWNLKIRRPGTQLPIHRASEGRVVGHGGKLAHYPIRTHSGAAWPILYT